MQVNRRVLNRRSFLKQCAAGAGGVAGAGLMPLLSRGLEAAAQPQKPNILWLIAEDFCPDLGCYGAPVVQTPNIDRFASQGARYTNAFVACPVCSPSRSALMTGMYQTSIGAHNHRTRDKAPLPEPVRLITDYFREAGYFTCNCSGDDWNQPGKTDWNFRVEKGFDGKNWNECKPGQPFYAQINFKETHRDFRRDPDNPIDPAKVILPPYYADHPVARRDWADYLESAQVLDKKVGQALKRLEDEGLAENTLVFFFGDNGQPHIRGKQFLYEGGIHVPLLVRWPGRIQPGTVVDDLVSTIDFGPSCMKAAGIQLPDYLQGRDFLGKEAKKRDRIFAARDRCDETVDRIRCVRDKRYKYIRNLFPERPYTQPNEYKRSQYPMLVLMQVLNAQGKLTPEQARFMAPIRPKEELYDLKADPDELRNLADDPKHKDVLERMRGELDKWIRETGDKGEIPEDPAIAESLKKGQREQYAKRYGKIGLSVDCTPEEQLKYWEEKLGVAK